MTTKLLQIPKKLFHPHRSTWTYFHHSDNDGVRLRKILAVARAWKAQHGAYSRIRAATGLSNEEIDLCGIALRAVEQYREFIANKKREEAL